MSTEPLRIRHHPDPVLRQRCEPVTAFDDELAELVREMFVLMRTGKGVGLAAPQVGVARRLFVMNATGQPADDRVLINPLIREPHGSIEGEEGCLSLPGVHVQIRRAVRCCVQAQDLQGRAFEFEAKDLVARIIQHETDHLNGVLLLDRMGPSDRMATRKVVQALEKQHRSGVTANKTRSLS